MNQSLWFMITRWGTFKNVLHINTWANFHVFDIFKSVQWVDLKDYTRSHTNILSEHKTKLIFERGSIENRFSGPSSAAWWNIDRLEGRVSGQRLWWRVGVKMAEVHSWSEPPESLGTDSGINYFRTDRFGFTSHIWPRDRFG